MGHRRVERLGVSTEFASGSRIATHPCELVEREQLGIAAAIVQVVGLIRGPLLPPGYAADATSADPSVAAAARDSFETAHRILGTTIGETFGWSRSPSCSS